MRKQQQKPSQQEFVAGKRVTVRLTKDVASLMNKATQGHVPYGWVSKKFNKSMRTELAQFAGKRELGIAGS